MAQILSLQSTIRMNSGHTMPLLGLGVFEAKDCYSACMNAFKHGYRHIDSAIYYRNEDEVGCAVKDCGLKREDLFITTKLFSSYGGTSASAINNSLDKIGSEYIDLYLIHDPMAGAKKRLELWKALIEAKKAGKVRTIGVSNYGIKHLEEIKENGLETPSVNQIELHPLCQQRPIVAYCNENGIVVQAYCPLIRGKFNIPLLQTLTKKYNKDPAQILVRWSLQKGFVPLPKSSNPDRIRSNADVYGFEISAEDMAALDALDQGKLNIGEDRASYCACNINLQRLGISLSALLMSSLDRLPWVIRPTAICRL